MHGTRAETENTRRTPSGGHAVHVVGDMNSATLPRTLDPHEKTIDLRVDRLRAAIARAAVIHTDPHPNETHARRTLTMLIENRIFVSAHTQTLIESIVATLPPDQQDAAITDAVRPLTLLVEEANVAEVRMRHAVAGGTA